MHVIVLKQTYYSSAKQFSTYQRERLLLLAYKPITLQENILYINMHFIRFKLFNDTKLITRSALSIMNILCVSLSSFQRELRVDKLVKCDT